MLEGWHVAIEETQPQGEPQQQTEQTQEGRWESCYKVEMATRGGCIVVSKFNRAD